MEDEKARKRHRRAYMLVKRLAPLVLRKYHYKTDVAPKVDYPYIIVANHLTESDMLMVQSACPEFCYIVAGEHLMRSKNAKLIKKYGDPILEYKGSVAINTVKEICTRVKAGYNIMLFPEGSRSFNGETVKLPNSIGKLIKTAKCGLCTYHITGGYFIAPRWAYTERKGPAEGKVMRMFSPEEIAKMTPAEITDIINTDIYENAYATQRKKMAPYKGERLAEGIENYLIMCPKCGGVDTISSHDDKFECTCGLKGTYTPEGFLVGEGMPYDNVYDWGEWCKKEFPKLHEGKPDSELLFTDNDIELFRVDEDHTKKVLYNGEIKVYPDHYEVGEYVFKYENIPVVNMLYFGKTLLFTYDKKHYGITGEHFHAIKSNMIYDSFEARQDKAQTKKQ